MNATSSIFIAGNSRSGTTMMSRILGNHPLIFTVTELHFFEQLWDPSKKNVTAINSDEAISLFCMLLTTQRDGYFSKREPEKFLDEAKIFFDSNKKTNTCPSVFMDFLIYESNLHQKKIPCEQTPQNAFFIEDILSIYENSKIICMVRDPRDILLSQKYKWGRRFKGADYVSNFEVLRSWFNYHPLTISKLWNSSAKKISKSIDNKNVHLIKFEELLNDPELVVRKLCDFLDIEYHDEMLLVPDADSSLVKDIPGKIGINRSKTKQFMNGKLSKTEIYLCQKITSKYADKFGYEKVDVGFNVFSLIFIFITFPVKLGIAVLLNLSRTKNLFAAIKRRF